MRPHFDVKIDDLSLSKKKVISVSNPASIDKPHTIFSIKLMVGPTAGKSRPGASHVFHIRNHYGEMVKPNRLTSITREKINTINFNYNFDKITYHKVFFILFTLLILP